MGDSLAAQPYPGSRSGEIRGINVDNVVE